MQYIVNILISDSFSRNEFAFVTPIRHNKNTISELGIEVSYFWELSDKALECDVLILSSDYVKKTGYWKNPEKVYSFLSSLSSKVNRLIWADMGDSSGTCQFGVMEYVNKYLKGSLLKDRSLYGQTFYGCRIFSDYYHNLFGIDDPNEGEPHLNIPLDKKEYFDKLELSWNQFYASYSHHGAYKDALLRKIKRIPSSLNFEFHNPLEKRTQLFNSRFSSNYVRETVGYQRKQIKELTASKIPTDRVSRKVYYKELRNSKYVISPFGWGEICYRDFEAIIAGATLIKPNCDHLETWPNFYQKGKTYLDIQWDFENFEETLSLLSNNDNHQYASMAQESQTLYQHLVSTDEGKKEFSTRFKHLVH